MQMAKIRKDTEKKEPITPPSLLIFPLIIVAFRSAFASPHTCHSPQNQETMYFYPTYHLKAEAGPPAWTVPFSYTPVASTIYRSESQSKTQLALSRGLFRSH
jgi:hypothetical protein